LTYDRGVVPGPITSSGFATRRRRFLVIDSDSTLVAQLAREKVEDGWEFDRRTRSVEAELVLKMKVEAVLIDPVAVGPSGWEYLGELSGISDLPLVVYTGRVSRERRVTGLRGGVDEWITKPMDPTEIVARLESVVRTGRPPSLRPVEKMSFGELVIEPRYRQAQIRGENLALTLRELDLLIVLARSEGRVVDRETLYRQAWGYSMPFGDRSVDVFVAKLRQKLDRWSRDFSYIHTHYGVGYRFEAVPLRERGCVGPAAVDRVDPRLLVLG
jgi:DNA-binding response OmpR family regulator